MKPIYINNTKGPRMRKGKFSTNIVSKELHKEFTESFPEYKNMKWDEFYQTWKDLAEMIRHETVNNPLGIKLGSYTGELKLQYLPHKFKAVDQANSNELGKEVLHTNLVNRGKVGKIKWERRWAVKFNRMLQFYAFEETREINKLAKDYIDNNSEKLRVSRNTLGGFSIWRNTIR